MFQRITRNAKTVTTAAVVAVVSIGGTAVAAATYDADNAHRVDGKHAVGAGASIEKRAGKLVATRGTNGRLPNNIIKRAPNAHKVDGFHAVDGGTSRTARAGKLVATKGNGRLPNNIIRKAPNANRLDGYNHTAFAKVGGFYSVFADVAGTLEEGEWTGAIACGTGDVAMSVGYSELPEQDVWGFAVSEDIGVAGWSDTSMPSQSVLSMSLMCLDTNGDAGGTASAFGHGQDGLSSWLQQGR